jgi:hypothetical protein
MRATVQHSSGGAGNGQLSFCPTCHNLGYVLYRGRVGYCSCEAGASTMRADIAADVRDIQDADRRQVAHG